ncbi:hypothetical protein BBJ28_00012244 [Nothophytophthora sp. Chile5]|nr:hypothetical protein BBJ28_00012244 [Nothophytophthora sp. Chile5]
MQCVQVSVTAAPRCNLRADWPRPGQSSLQSCGTHQIYRQVAATVLKSFCAFSLEDVAAMEHDDVSGVGAQASELQEEKEEAPSYSSPPAAETADDAPPEPEAAAGNVEETEADTIEVNLKFIHHDRVSLHCSPQIHVAELKERVVVEVEHASSAAEGAGASESTANLRLIYKGKVLKDDQTLASYHFQDGDTLHAVFGRPNTTPMSPEAAPAVDPEPTTPPTTSSGMQDMGNGVVMGSFEMEAGMPDIGGLINSMLAGFGGAGPGAAGNKHSDRSKGNYSDAYAAGYWHYGYVTW